MKVTSLMELKAILETILDEALSFPQVGGAEATIIEQVERAQIIVTEALTDIPVDPTAEEEHS